MFLVCLLAFLTTLPDWVFTPTEGDVFDDDLGVWLWATLRDAPWRARPTDQAREAGFKRVEAFRRLARARALREHDAVQTTRMVNPT